VGGTALPSPSHRRNQPQLGQHVHEHCPENFSKRHGRKGYGESTNLAVCLVSESEVYY
jgi:hypothetical protein